MGNIIGMDSKKEDLDKSTDDINRESQNNFEESGVEDSESDKTEMPPSPELYDDERQKANSSFRKRHFVDEILSRKDDSESDDDDDLKITRTEVIIMFVRILEQRYGPNWESYLPIKISYSDDYPLQHVMIQLYYLMPDDAKDRLHQIWDKGEFVQDGYKKKATKKAKTIKGVANTTIASVQRQLGIRFYQTHFEVGLTDFSKLEKDPKTGQYRHMNAGLLDLVE